MCVSRVRVCCQTVQDRQLLPRLVVDEFSFYFQFAADDCESDLLNCLLRTRKKRKRARVRGLISVQSYTLSSASVEWCRHRLGGEDVYLPWNDPRQSKPCLLRTFRPLARKDQANSIPFAV